MSVSVTIPSTSAVQSHPEGASIKVVDGHLHVLAEDKFPVAIYAPNAWRCGKATVPGATDES